MRKHFLILMLLTLLPLVGWATKPGAISGLSLIDQTYNKESHELITGTIGWPATYNHEAAGAGIKYFVKSSYVTPNTSDAGWVTSIPAETDAGDYYVWYYLEADGEAFDEDGDVTYMGIAHIRKADFPTSNDDDFVAPTAKEGIIFSGNAQTMFNGGTAPTGGTIKYGVTSDAVTYTDANDNALKATSVAQADKIYYQITGCKNYNDSEVRSISVEMAKATVDNGGLNVEKSSESVSNLVFNNGAQTLMTQQTIVRLKNNTAIDIEYKNVTLNTTSTTWDADNLKGINAGSYTIEVYAINDYYLANVEFAKFDFTTTIAKADVTLTEPTKASDWTYDGTEKSLLATDGSATNGTLVYYLGENQVTKDNVKALDAGTYTVSYSVTGDANYNDIAKKSIGTVTVAKKPLTVAAQTKTVDWTGDPIDKAELYKATGFVAADDANKATILADLLDVNVSTTEAMGATDAGVHTVTLSEKAGQTTNYTADFLVETSSLTINKVAATAATVAGQTVDFTGEAQTLATVTGNAVGGEMQYSLDGTNYDTAIPQGTDAKEYTVYYKVVGDKNHTDVDAASVAAKINKVAATAATVAGNTVDFSGENQALATVTGAANGGTMMYSLAEDGEYTENVPVASAAGDYTVWYKVVADANHTDVAASSVAAKINKVAATAATVTANALSYTGEAQALITVTGEAVGGEMLYSLDGGEYSATIPTATDFKDGGYTVSYKVNADANHTAPDAVDVIANIGKIDVVATAPQALALTYNGAKQNLVTAGEATGAEIQFLNGDEWSTTIPQGTNAGAYTVQYKYVADANHNEKAGGEIAVNIQKFNLKFELGNKDADWTGEQIPAEGAYILSVGALQGDDKIGEEGAFSLAFPEEVKNAGTYKFNQLTATFNGAENYTILFSGNAEVKVNAVDIVAADFEAPVAVEDALIFNGKAQTLFVAGEMVNNYGEIQYSADGETWSAELTDALKQGTAAAEYKLYYKVVADGNHNDFVAEAPLTKTIAAKAWEPNVVAFLGDVNLEYTYATEQAKGYDFMPAAADLVLFDGKNKLTADDYELVITNTQIDPETEEPVVATKAINADTYTFTYTGKGNYDGNKKVYTLTINKKQIDDVFALNVEEAEYTSENQIASVTVTNTLDLVENTDYTVAKPEEAINKGQYDVTITLGENYTFAENENAVVKQFEITPAQILISAGDVEKTYDGLAGLAVAGKAALQPELNYAGLKKNDKVEDVITNVAAGAVTVKDAAAAAAEYALGIDLTKFTVAEGNYTVKANDVQGKLTINKRDMAITFADRDEEGNYLISKAYGADDDFTDVATLVELDNNVAADADAIIAGITITRSNADVNAVGKYDGVLEIATEGDVFANYNVTATDKGDFEITAGKLTIALKTSTGKVYDGAAPEASWTVSAADLAVTGMKESDKIEEIFTTMPTATIQAPAKDAGTYVIKLDGAVTPNYEIGSYLDGQYIITPKALTATVEAQTVQIDAEVLPHPAAFQITGAEEGDDLKAKLNINVSTAAKGVFANGIELTIDNDNYTLPATFGELTVIDPAAVAEFDVADADLFDAIKAAEGATTVNITGREVASKKWIAFVLPFDVTVEQLCDVFGYSIINTYDADNSSAAHMKFQIEQDGVPANTPFIIKPKKAYAADKNMTFEEVVVKAPASAKVEIEVGGNTFVGQYEEFTIVKKDVPNSTYLRAGGWKRAKNSDRVIEPFDCYITWPEGAEAPSISIEDEGGVTKIATITTDGRIIEAEGWYTVNGMKLDAAPTEKGVYIKDGKKVVIK